MTGGLTTAPLSEETLRAFINRSDTPMLLSDDELRYRDANEAACRLFGLSRDRLLEGSIGDLSPPDSTDDVAARTATFQRSGTLSGRVAVLAARGERVEVDFSAIANVVPGLHLSMLAPVGSDDGLSEETEGEEAGDPLSPREREVLTALALGQTGAEIAADLLISPETVRNHVRNARAKLGARTRAQAIARALQRGEIHT